VTERVLLDTHVLVEMIDGTRRRWAPHIEAAVSTRVVALFASVASLWEIAIKVRIGRLPIRSSLDDLPQVLDALDLSILMIDPRHVLAELTPDPRTRDPFDRLLLAQCQVEDMRLATIDRALVDHPMALR
jgi:PIN domain nuclease of toxin-antitoxin system